MLVQGNSEPLSKGAKDNASTDIKLGTAIKTLEPAMIDRK
jgi:hypothetical protein